MEKTVLEYLFSQMWNVFSIKTLAEFKYETVVRPASWRNYKR